MRILLAEDDTRLGRPLVDWLERERHGVTWVTDGADALAALLADSYDIALLDWMLPGRDGLSIVKELRRCGRTTLVLMLTARDGLDDLVLGLREGADDYLVKPFRMGELSARINSLARRSARPYRPRRLVWRQLQLDAEAAQAFVDDRPLALTQREWQLLEWFLLHPGQLFNRSQLLERLWSLDSEAGEDAVKTHLNNLRRKLRQAGADDPIETIHGRGYRLARP